MKRYKIEHIRPECIGCGACAALTPDFWEMDEDGKSNIINGKRLENGEEELEIEEKDLEANREAAESCPVNIIHIKDLDSDEQLI